MALSEALKTNGALTTLNLMSNSVGHEGAHALLEALKVNTTLTILDLEYDSLGKEGVLLLSKTNTTLADLDFTSKSIGMKGLMQLQRRSRLIQPCLLWTWGSIQLRVKELLHSQRHSRLTLP
ncbi:hypothetical protein BCR41DRAFT_65776 [Lobosporangium transversale]|uniref:Uncharacterized protein n=1 Tax=Lobosporangium transversale TaxID=64571 RepID=A0A1Y2GP62_9FUNG|nr:hypothetical protein BCR41DRAFT_65776 [Lobosporangium transversale]ORZ15561.1 hypothetical protein BCR41DRAFT_65776 [Lobosporangium transversale]|eukprot:XP_021881309.1 hypothetical protein BCR41DRAFT_65776 [Lobosporangium transversale]